MVGSGVGVGSGSTIPGSVSADPDPHQNEADPKHCKFGMGSLSRSMEYYI